MTNEFKPVPCEILDITKESKHEYTFKVKTDIKVNHGQFLEVSIPFFGEAPISVSDFGEGYLSFTIRSVGKVTDAIFNKQKGDTLYLRGAYGNGWPYEELSQHDLVIITGGTGLAPVRSMIKSLISSDYLNNHKLTLVSGFKNAEGIIFQNDLMEWKDKINTIYTLDNDEKEGWNTGLVTKFLPEIDYGKDCRCVVVGPPMMMKFTCQGLMENGIKAEDIYVSFERKMSCAVGKCGNCRVDEVYVCQDGPVFKYDKAKDLLD